MAKIERGDLDLSLWLTGSTKVLILDKLDYSLHFFSADTIASFNKRIYNKWAMASAVVIRLQREVDGRFKIIVVNGDASKDVQMICIQVFYIVYLVILFYFLCHIKS